MTDKKFSDLTPGQNVAIRTELADAITLCSRLSLLFRADEDRQFLARRAGRHLVWLEESINEEDDASPCVED